MTSRGPEARRRRLFALAFAAILLAAGLLRAFHQIEIAHNDILARVPEGDERTFLTTAQRVAHGEDDQVPYQAPLYPTLLGGLSRVVSNETALLTTTRTLQSLLGLGAAAIAGVLAFRLTGQRRAALIAVALVALAKPLLHAEGTLLRETAATTLLAALTLAYVQALAGAPSLERHVALGLAVGLGLVLRENFAVVAAAVLIERALVLGASLFGAARRSAAPSPSIAQSARASIAQSARASMPPAHSAALAALGLLLGVGLPLLPFDVKVARLGDGVHVLPHWNSGCVFFLANRRDNPSPTGYSLPAFVVTGNPEAEQAGFRQEAERRAGHALGSHEVSRFWLNEGISEILAAPSAFASRVIQRLAASVAPWEMAHQRDPDVDARFSWVLRAPLPGVGPLLALAALGGVTALASSRGTASRVSRGECPGERALWIVLGSWWLSLVVAAFTTRYRVPAIPLLAVASARGLVGIQDLVRSRKRARAALSLLFFVGLTSIILFVLPARRIAADPTNALRTRAFAALKTGDHALACPFFDEASRLRGDQDPELLERLGECWLRLHQARKAWACYVLLASEHGPPSEDVLRCLALAEIQQGRAHAALSLLETALARAPGDKTLGALLALAGSNARRGPDAPLPEGAREDPRRLLR